MKKCLQLWVVGSSLLATGPSLSGRPRQERQNVPLGVVCGVVLLVGVLGDLVRPVLGVDTRGITIWRTILRRMTPEAVRRAPLFRDLSWRQARRVVRFGSLEVFRTGQFAARKGEAGTTMYMVISGLLRVFDRTADGREQTLDYVGPGMLSGAVDLVGAGVVMAHVVAMMPSEVLALDHRALERIGKRFPFTGATLFRNVAATITERLRVAFEALMRTGSPVSLDRPVLASASAVRHRAVMRRCGGLASGQCRPVTRVGVGRRRTVPAAARGWRARVHGAGPRRCPGLPVGLRAGPLQGRGGAVVPAFPAEGRSVPFIPRIPRLPGRTPAGHFADALAPVPRL